MWDMGSITQNKAISPNVFLILGIPGLMENPKNSNHKSDDFVKSPKFVMPDLIRHPESTEITGFRLSPE